VRDEAGAGRDRGRLVPVQIDATMPPLGFRQFQAIDLSAWKGRADDPKFAKALASAVRFRMRLATERTEGAATSLARIRPDRLVASAEAELGSMEASLRAALATRLERLKSRLIAGERQLKAVGPAAVLERGFSVTLDRDGRAVRDAADVTPGEIVTTRVASGAFTSRVESPGSLPPPKK
jgi:exonuclease VII large subunit